VTRTLWGRIRELVRGKKVPLGKLGNKTMREIRRI